MQTRNLIGDAWVDLHHGLLTACGSRGETASLWGDGLAVAAPVARSIRQILLDSTRDCQTLRPNGGCQISNCSFAR